MNLNVKLILLIINLVHGNMSRQYIKQVNKKMRSERAFEDTIINLFFGLLFRDVLKNLRCYYPGIIPEYDKSGKRKYVSDRSKSENTPTESKASKSKTDILAKWIIKFFPSPSGTLCSTTTSNENFSKKYFSDKDKERKYVSIEALGSAFAKILNSASKPIETIEIEKADLDLDSFVKLVEDMEKLKKELEIKSTETEKADLDSFVKSDQELKQELEKELEKKSFVKLLEDQQTLKEQKENKSASAATCKAIKIIDYEIKKRISLEKEQKKTSNSILQYTKRLYNELSELTKITDESTNKGKIHFALMLIHTFAMDVLETEDEYQYYLRSIIDRLPKDMQIPSMFKVENKGMSLKNDKNGSMVKILNLLYEYEYQVDKFPYSSKNQPVTNKTISNYERKKKKHYSGDNDFSDCVEITILHICNCLFFDDESQKYSIEHLKLNKNSELAEFYTKYNEPCEITMDIRNDWSKVVQDLSDLNIVREGEKEKEKEKNIPINYLKKKTDTDINYRNEITPGLMNIATVLAKICESSENDKILKSYDSLFKASSSGKYNSITDEFLGFIESIAPTNLGIALEGDLKKTDQSGEYYGDIKLEFESLDKETKTTIKTTMQFSTEFLHSEAKFISRTKKEDVNDPLNYIIVNDGCLENPNPLEYLLRSYVLDLKGNHKIDFKDANFHFFYYQNLIKDSDDEKQKYLKILYDLLADEKHESEWFSINELDIKRTCEMVIRTATLEDPAVKEKFLPYYIKTESLKDELNELEDKQKIDLWIRVHKESSLESGIVDGIVKAWDTKIASMEKISDLIDLNTIDSNRWRIHMLSKVENSAESISIKNYTDDQEVNKELIDALKSLVKLKELKIVRCRDIKKLNLINQLCGLITKPNGKLTSLDLEWNKIGYEGAKCISEALKHENNNITSLNLSGNYIGKIGAKDLSDALKLPNNKITSLNLWGNKIGYEGAKDLSDALKHENNKITSLNLGSNEIGDEGAKDLSDSLKDPNNNLTSLNLGGNNIGDEGADHFIESLNHENSKLKVFTFDANSISSEKTNEIIRIMESRNKQSDQKIDATTN
ncbi:hypothetical protein OCOL_001471 [Ordospora colligata]